MAQPPLQSVLDHLRSRIGAEVEALADRDLLARFVNHREEAAFAALVQRHGPMVFGVCRRVTRSLHDAEDAWQATFLVLAKKATSIRKQASLAAWLHGVALRVAAKVRERSAKHPQSELSQDVAQPPAGDELTWRELQHILDEELQRLPDRFRQPLVLCYLQGKTRDEAADELGWSLTTFRGRLDTAREQLRKRLDRRGVSLPAAMLATLLSQAGASSLPISRVEATIQAAVSGSVPAALAPLIVVGVSTMSATKLTLLSGLALTIALLGGGTIAMLSGQGPAEGAQGPKTEAAKDPADKPMATRSNDTAKNDLAAARLKDVEKHLDRLQIAINLMPDDPEPPPPKNGFQGPGNGFQGPGNGGKGLPFVPKHHVRYVILNVLPIPVEPHGNWPSGMPIGADALISKEQAGKIVAALDKLGFFNKALTAIPGDFNRKPPYATLQIRYRSSSDTEPENRVLWLPIDWNMGVIRHVQALRGGVDGRAAKALDEMMQTLDEERRKWESEENPWAKLQGRWSLTAQEWNAQVRPIARGNSGRCVVTDDNIEIELYTAQSGPAAAYRFSGKLQKQGNAPVNMPAEATDRRDLPFVRGLWIRGHWSDGAKDMGESEAPIWVHEKNLTVKVPSPAQPTVFLVFKHEPEWGEPQGGARIRLRPTKRTWGVEVAPEFRVDLENLSKQTLGVSRIPYCEVEVDGVWFTPPNEEKEVAGGYEVGPASLTENIAKVVLERSRWVRKVAKPEGQPAPLKLTLGRHTIRVACNVDRLRPLITNPVEIEIVDPDETGWGEAVDGLQLRGRADSSRWTVGEKPSFSLDLRNRFTQKWEVTAIPPMTEIEVDGTWYAFGGVIDYKAPLQELKSGDQQIGWLTVSPDKGWIVRDIGMVPAPLEWKAGKHIIRLGYTVKGNVRLVTRSFTVEVTDPTEALWGPAVEGVQLRARVSKIRWTTDEKPTFELDLRNRGTQKWDIKPSPTCVKVELDGIWYTHKEQMSVLDGYPVTPTDLVKPVPLKPGEALDKWLTITPDQNWNSGKPGDLRAAYIRWGLGKHKVRLNYFVGAKELLSQIIEIEMIDPKDAGWGEAVDGLQLRGRSTKERWKTDEKPTFELDLRNSGKEKRTVSGIPPMMRIQIDGVWFAYMGPLGYPGSLHDLKPGETLTKWLTSTPDSTWTEQGDAANATPAKLEWTPGKHRVRLGYQLGNNPPATTESFEIAIIEAK